MGLLRRAKLALKWSRAGSETALLFSRLQDTYPEQGARGEQAARARFDQLLQSDDFHFLRPEEGYARAQAEADALFSELSIQTVTSGASAVTPTDAIQALCLGLQTKLMNLLIGLDRGDYLPERFA